MDMKPFWTSNDGRHVLYRGDCLEILPGLASGSVDTVVTDPPYGIGFKYKTYVDNEESWEAMMNDCIGLLRAMADRVVVFTGITAIGLLPRPDWVCAHAWATTGAYGKCGYNQWMPIAVYGADAKGFGSVNGVLKSDLLYFSGGDGVGFLRDKLSDGHPCPKPVPVMLRMLNRFSHTDATILDPFAGSGTTGVAAIRTGRRSIMIELEPAYCDIIVRRMEAELAQPYLPTLDPQRDEQMNLDMLGESTE